MSSFHDQHGESATRRSQHELHLHASDQLVELRVAGELGVSNEVTQLLLNIRL